MPTSKTQKPKKLDKLSQEDAQSLDVAKLEKYYKSEALKTYLVSQDIKPIPSSKHERATRIVRIYKRSKVEDAAQTPIKRKSQRSSEKQDKNLMAQKADIMNEIGELYRELTRLWADLSTVI
jgi:hypothetical protein